MSATMLAKIGLAQLVPATLPDWPSHTIVTFSAGAATSGNPREVALKRPALVLPSVFKYAETASS